MPTMTVAQALASSATGITIADTPANIAAVVSNTALRARVNLFTFNANGASNASDARLIATLGSAFSTGPYRYTVRDTVAALTASKNAAGLSIASALSVFDTLTNLLAAEHTTLMQRASSVVLSTGTSLSLSALLRLEALPAFSVLPGQNLTLADSATNLLALTPAQNRAAIKAFQVTGNGTVTLSQANTLKAMPSFSVANGARLTVSGDVSTMTAGNNATAISTLNALAGITINVTDTVARVVSSVSALTGLASRASSTTVTLTGSGTINATQANGLVPLVARLSATNANITLADTATNLLGTTGSVAALARATSLTSDATVTAAQQAALTAMRGFAVANGVHLTVSDTLAALQGLTAQQRAAATEVVLRDTLPHLLAAAGLPSGTSAIVVQLDQGTYTAAQAAQIAALASDGVTMTLQPTGGATEMVVTDTVQAILANVVRLTALAAHGPIVVTPTNQGVTLSAASAAALAGLSALDIGAARIAVSDTGEAVTAARDALFGADVLSITVTGGVFRGSVDQLLDPRLHLGTTPVVSVARFATLAVASTPAAHLASDATVSAAQMISLSLLPGFSVDPGVTLTVADTPAALVAAASAIAPYATSISVEDDATLTVAEATTLADLRSAVGAANFTMGTHTLTVSDSAGHLAATANPAWDVLATAIELDSDSVVTAAEAQILLAFGARFSPNGQSLVVIDTATALSGLVADSAAVTALNGWNVPVLLSADGVLSVAAVEALLQFDGFGPGSHRLIIADTAANLLAGAGSPALALASAVRLGADATVTAADGAILIGLHNFGVDGHALTVADTPAKLLGMSSALAALATGESLVPRTVGNAADYTITAAQLTQLQAMTNLSVSGFTGLITVADTAAALAALAPSFANVTLGSLLARVVVSLTGDATLGASAASALAQLPGFALGGHALTVHDTPAALLAAGASTGIGMASSVGISGPTTVSVATLTALAGLHAFASDDYALVCADTPTALLNLAGSAAAFASRMELAAPAGNAAAYTLGTSQFVALATMAKLSLTGFTGSVVVLDTPANLAALASSFASAAAGSPLLAARAVMAAQVSQDGSVSVAELQSLIALPQFQLNGHSLALQDTPTALLAASSSTLAVAASITLASNAQAWTVTAAQAARLAALPNFTPGSTGFAVVDTASALLAAGNAAGVALADHLQLSTPATLSVADAVTLIGMAGFQNGGASLVIADTLPHLLSLGGITLTHNDAVLRGTSIGLSGDATGTAANLVSLGALPQGASFSRNGHALVLADTGSRIAGYTPSGGVAPTGYVMVGDATLTAAQATLLAARTVDLDGNALTIADGVTALLDSANAAGEAIATTLRLNGNATVSVAQAGLLFAMPTFNTGGYALTISGSASGLIGLGTTAKQFATTLALAAAETVDVTTVTALAQFGFKFDRAGHTLTVQDTASRLVTLDDFEIPLVAAQVLAASATVTAAVAETLAALPAFALANGVTLTVQDDAESLVGLSAAARAIASAERLPTGAVTITAAQVAGLRALPHFVSSGTTISVQSDTVAHVLAYASDVAAIGATIAIFDTAAHVQASLDALRALPASLVSSITLSDGGTPALTMTVAALAADAATLAAIVSPYTITISDTAAHIQADLASGASSTLVLNRTLVASVVVSDAGTVALTDTQALVAGVADSTGAVMARLTGGSFTVSSATIAHLDALAALTVPPASIAVVDTTAAIQSDLVSGSSRLLAHRAVLSGIAASGGTITLTAAQVRAAHVDDGAGSIFSLLSGATLVVSGVSVADADTIAGLPVAPQSFAISDTAAAIQADLALGSGSRLLAHLSVISGIGISNAGTVSLTATQALVAGIDDGAGSAIAKLSGGSFVVTGATVAQIAAIAALSIAPSSVTVSDTAAHLQADLASGSSALLAQAGLISTIVNADSGVIVLTVAQIRAAGVDDGPGSALARLQGGSIAVAGAQLADIATLLALPIAPSSIAISDTAAAITADLASGSSLLLAHAAAISGIAVSDGGTISLTVAQISAAGVDDGAGSVLAKTTGGVLAVTGATVADLVPLAALTRTPTSITVVDTAAHIQADLAGGSPLLLANAGQITSISTIEASATFTLSVAQLAALPTVLAEIATPYQVAISDTAGHVEASLTGASSVLIQAGSSLSGITLTDGSLPTITLSVAALSASTTVLPLIGSSYHLDVADTTSAVQADLAAAVSVLRAEAATLHAVAVTGGTVLSLTAIQVLRSGVATVLAVTSGLTNVLVTGVAISQVATIAGLGIGQLLMAISDSGAALEADLTSGTPVLVSNVSSISGISLTDGTTPTLHLQVAQLAAAATVIARIGTPFAIAISDTAAHVQSDLASGGSVLLAHAGALTGITLTDGGVPPIALSMTQVDAASAVLALIGGSFALSIADTAANVQADLTSATPALLAMLPDLAGITLTDGGSPTITLTVAQIAADAAALSLIGSSWTLGVQDTAAHVQVDLAAGALSEILARLGRLGTVTLTSGSTITLTEAQATYSGVATVLAAIGNLGSLVVTGVAVAQISTVLGLGIGSTSMQVVDSAANVQSDLTGAGTLLTNVSQVSAITLTDVTPIITLTIAQVSADNAVLARIGMPWHLAIADTAAHLQSDLAAGATSELLGHAAVLSGVTLTSGTSITLTEAQVTYAGVAGVLAATTGLTSLAVTGVAVAQIPTVLGLGIANTSLTIVDTAAQVQSDLTGPGALLTHASQISAITLTDGGTPTFVFSIAQVAADEALLSRIGVPWQLAILDTAAHLQADLAAGASSELLTYGATLTNATLIIVTLTSPATITLTESEVTRAGVAAVLQATTGLLGLDVTGVTVGQISTVRGLGIANTRLAISDTAANVQADLTGGSSLLADGTIAPTLTALTLTDGSAPTLTLSIAQTTAAATALSLIGTTWHLAISDTAANVQSDLASGGASTLLARATVLSGVALTSGTTITLTEAQATRAGVASVLAATTGLSSFVVTGATIAQVATVLALGVANTTMTVTDTAANLQADLNLASGSVLLTNVAQVTNIALSDGGTPTLSLNVAGLTSASPVLTVLTSSYNLALSDTAANVQADLAAGNGSEILNRIGSLASITLSSGNTITLTESQAVHAGVASALNATIGLVTFAVTGVSVGQIGTVFGLSVTGTRVAVADSAANVQSDLNGGGVLLAHVGNLSGITLTDGSTPTLTLSVSTFGTNAGVIALISTAFNLTISDTAANVVSDLTGGSSQLVAHAGVLTGIVLTDGGTPALSLTVAVIAASVPALTRITTPYTITVSDTAAQVQSDLTSGSSGLVTMAAALGTITLTDGSTPTITLSVAQIGAAATVLSDIGSAYNLVAVDSAAHVQADLALGNSSVLLARGAALTGITLSSGSTITLTESQAVHAGVATALGLVSGMTTFAVTGVTVAQIATVLGLGVSGTRMAIADTAANVQSDLTGSGTLATNAGVITAIALIDGETPTLTLTVAQVSAGNAVLALMSGPWSLAIADSAANVASDLAAGAGSTILSHAGVLGSITLSGGTVITLTESQAVHTGVAAALIATTNLSSFVVTGATVAQFPTVVALAVPNTSVAISDTAANVQSNLTGTGSLLANLSKLGSIALTDGSTPAITLNVAQLGANSSVLARIGSAYNLAVADLAQNVQTDLALGAGSTLVGHNAVLTQLNVASGVITLTSAQVQVAGIDDGASSVLSKMSGATLHVTDVAVSEIATILALNFAPASITVRDSAANIAADLSGAALITSNASAITSVRTTETTLSATTATLLYNGLHSSTIFDESALTVTDTAAALLTAQGSAPAMLAAALHVTMSDNPTGLSAAQATTLSSILGGVLQNAQTMGVSDTLANLLLPSNAAGIALATSVTLSAPTTTTAALATQLAGLHAYTAGPALTVQDSVANLLDAAYAAGIAAATTVSPNANVTVSAATLTALSALNGYAAGSYTLTVQDTVTAILGLSQPQLALAGIVSVQDTTADVMANVAALQSAIPGQGHTLSITLTDATINVLSIDVTATDYAAAIATYAAIAPAGVIRVTGNAAQLAAIAAALQSNTAVGEVDVVDTADNILSNLTALDSIGSKFMKATISDTVVNAAEVASLLTVPHLIANNLTIQDTGTQIAAAILANGTPGMTFMNAHDVTLSADSVIGAADAVLLEQLTSFSKNGHQLYIWDTAAHLTDSASGYLAAAQHALIDGVYLKATGHIATVSASLAATLLSISAFNRNDPPAPAGDGVANTLLVQDTAARIETYFATLSANRAALSGVVVSANATVNDSVFGHLLALGATMDSGKTLTVRDTAANIIANAPSQTSGNPSITPVAWQISGSASVSTAGAILLGGLPGFAVGAYTLTLTDSATVTVAQANTLGALGNSLRLGGNTLDVYGTVATMTVGPGLSNNAKLIVTPHITDTFANLATLTLGSGLLGGTIVVSDSESVTVAQASAFLGLIGGSGIPAANVAFGGNVESITDTLAAIQTLTGGAAWTSTGSLHGSFHLVVADTVATLINGSNTAALAAMNGTTIAANETITAAAAESLFAVSSGIHFSKGAHTLTIEDTAANLLNPAYSDGVALADALQLSADGTVAAADAEALLTNSRFHLNHTLTVADTAASLLDGVLAADIAASPYAASIVVQLAGPETLDAGTARAIVNLPGYQDTGNLTIADGASYLLNSANHAAELLATSVTLTGDETVSIATAERLDALPHFTIGSNTLHLASNDFADTSALVTIGDLGSHWDSGGFNIRMTQDSLALTPSQYAALQDDNIVLNGHALSALATGIVVSSASGTVQITGNGVANATLNVYASNGTLLSQTAGVAESFTASASEASIGNGVVVTQTVGASAATSESAPIIALERTVLTNAATSAGATFASSGAVQVDTGKYVDLYTNSSAPAHPSSPVLVYDSSSYTLSLSIDGQAALTLVTLGTATHPMSLMASEIYIQHFV